MKNILAFIFGGLFSVGLMFSGMANPEKVLGFLDIAGADKLPDVGGADDPSVDGDSGDNIAADPPRRAVFA